MMEKSHVTSTLLNSQSSSSSNSNTSTSNTSTLSDKNNMVELQKLKPQDIPKQVLKSNSSSSSSSSSNSSSSSSSSSSSNTPNPVILSNSAQNSNTEKVNDSFEKKNDTKTRESIEKNIETLKKNLEEKEKKHGKEDLQLVEILIELGDAYNTLRQLEKAKEPYERALKIREKNYTRHSELLVPVLVRYANICHDLRDNDADKLFELYSRILEIRERHHGKNDVPLISVLFNLGEYCQKTSLPYSAKEYYERVIRAIQQESSKANDKRLILPLLRLGHLHYDDITEFSIMDPYFQLAQHNYSKALEIAKEHYGENLITIECNNAVNSLTSPKKGCTIM